MESTSETEKKSLFLRCWEGDIKLWQAFWLVHILGFIFSCLIGLMPQLAVLALLNIRLPMFITFLPVIAMGVFSTVTLWRSSPDPKVSILGALVRLWVFAFSFYLCFLAYIGITK